jgi:uncharacterized membrane protein
MTQSSLIGLVALVVGVALLYFAWQGTNAPADQLSEAMTGRFTSSTLWFLILGLIGVVAGAGMLLRGVMER